MIECAPASCIDAPGSPLCAADVCRGVTRLLYRHDLLAIAEVPLDNSRRADLMAVDPQGRLVIVEIKVARADLMGDGKWPHYLGWCDRYFWAVPGGFDLALFDQPALLPDRAGLIVADRYDAAVVREAATVALAPHVRRRAMLAFARRAARRVATLTDPELAAL